MNPEKFESNQRETLDQGVGASRAFEGKEKILAIEKLYGESAKFFAEKIKEVLPPRDEPYTMSVLDVGSYRGEFLNDLISQFGEGYKFDVTAIDANESALRDNHAANMKVVGDVAELPFKGNAFDITVMRYVLPWNNIDEQKQILSEVNRVSGRYAIVQHAGSVRENSNEWQRKFHQLFLGDIPKLKRDKAHFSSPDEVESWMKEQGIQYNILQDRIVPGISDLFISKYDLSYEDARKVKTFVDGTDCIEQVAYSISK